MFDLSDYGSDRSVRFEHLKACDVYQRITITEQVYHPKLVDGLGPLLPNFDDQSACREYDGLFCAAITYTDNHLELLLIAEDVRACKALTAEYRDNLLLNINNKL